MKPIDLFKDNDNSFSKTLYFQLTMRVLNASCEMYIHLNTHDLNVSLPVWCLNAKWSCLVLGNSSMVTQSASKHSLNIHGVWVQRILNDQNQQIIIYLWRSNFWYEKLVSFVRVIPHGKQRAFFL